MVTDKKNPTTPQDSEAKAEAKASKKSQRGFASMSAEKQREIASKGGHAAHAKGTAHEFSADEARAAGRKGGETVSRDRAHMAAIGRAGGHNSHRNRRASGTQKAAQPGKADEASRDTESEPLTRAEDTSTHAEASAPQQERHASPQNDTHYRAS
jgi:hypothetical protein